MQSSLRIAWLLFFTASFYFSFSQSVVFIENKGQWHDQVKFLASTPNGKFYVLNGGHKVSLHNKQDLEAARDYFTGHSIDQNQTENTSKMKQLTIRSHAYAVSFDGAQKSPQLTQTHSSSSVNYFIDNDPKKWGRSCKVFSELVYKDVYPDIDVRYYVSGDNIEYDFIVHPGADPSKIVLRFDGADKLGIVNGTLSITTSLGGVEEQVPLSFQEINGKQQKLKTHYELYGNLVRFKIDDYDKNKTLVIDPEIVFSSFTGSGSDNWGYAATYDSKGNFYSAGIVFGTSYPVSVGAYQTVFAGGSNTGENAGFDIGIIKFNPDGTQRLYATYLGGSFGNELPSSLMVDQQDNLVILGRTTSGNFPSTATKYGVGGGWDIFVSKLDVSGSVLLGSRVIGGSQDDGVNIRPKYSATIGPSSLRRTYSDDVRSDITMDILGNIYIGSCTQSSNFPVTPGVLQPALSALQDAIILKLDATLNIILFSTYLGGSGDDAIYSICLSEGAGLYLAGGTASTNFPGNKTGTIGPVFNGGICDGFIAKISLDGKQLIRSAFIGTNNTDQVFGIDRDASGSVYIGGTSKGSMPVVNAAFSQAGGKQFISKLDSNFTTYKYATVFGPNVTNPNIAFTGFSVDRCENVYIVGWGGVVVEMLPPYESAGTTGLSTTANAYQQVTDGRDFYFFVMARDATKQLYGSFFGQNAATQIADHSDGGMSRFTKEGMLYLAICANCQGGVFPTTAGVWATTNTSGRCNQVAVKFKLDFATCPLSNKLYVDINATGSNDGSTWINAYNSFADAVERLNTTDGIDSIFVATGTYIDNTFPASGFIVNRKDAIILGGFPTGGGTRDPILYPVYLQGNVRFLKSGIFDGFRLQ